MKNIRNAVIGIAIGIAVSITLLIVTYTPWRPYWKLLPENEGAITTIAFQYTKVTGTETKPVYESFIKQIDPNVDIIAVTGRQEDTNDFNAFVNSAKLPNPKRIHVINVGTDITSWCKDRFLVTDTSPSTLLRPQEAQGGLVARMHDTKVADTIHRNFPTRFYCATLPLQFDSGDIVATKSYVIFSHVLAEKNKGLDIHTMIKRLFGRRIIYLSHAPSHHIGMFAAPIDNKTIITGDPSLGSKMWTTSLAKRFPASNFTQAATKPFYDAMDEFQKAGFKTISVPTVIFGPQTFISYTNGVFETRNGQHIVYMPWYDIPTMDNYAKQAYESAGWQVRPVAVRNLYQYRGTIGCLINVLKRDNIANIVH